MRTEQLTSFLIFSENTVIEAMQKIDRNAKGILFVEDERHRLIGTVTDGDVRRWLIRTGKLDGQVGLIMNKSPKSIYPSEISSAGDIMERYEVTALPVIDAEGIILDIVLRREAEGKEEGRKASLAGVTVVIMAGGKGTRLYPYTKILPKPLIPIGDIPIMERILHRFQDFGVDDFYCTVNYKKNMIKSYFSECGLDCRIRFVEEDMPLGTAGSLSLIKERFDRPFMLTNCDILIHADYGEIYRYHEEAGNEMTIVAALKNIMIPYGIVHSGEDGAVSSMEEKPRLSYFVNTGMYVLSQGLMEEIPKDTFFHMTDLAGRLLEEGRKVGMYPVSEDAFLDMGEFEEMRRMEERLSLKSE